jgi:hypothetical protein
MNHAPETVAATLLAYLDASGALSASAATPEAIVDVAPGAAQMQGLDDEDPAPLDPGDAAPLEVAVGAEDLPPFRVDQQTGEVSAPFGVLEAFADDVRALAKALGEHAVALVAAPTSDGTPFALSAREGEGLVVVIGDETYPWEDRATS